MSVISQIWDAPKVDSFQSGDQLHYIFLYGYMVCGGMFDDTNPIRIAKDINMFF